MLFSCLPVVCVMATPMEVPSCPGGRVLPVICPSHPLFSLLARTDLGFYISLCSTAKPHFLPWLLLWVVRPPCCSLLTPTPRGHLPLHVWPQCPVLYLEQGCPLPGRDSFSDGNCTCFSTTRGSHGTKAGFVGMRPVLSLGPHAQKGPRLMLCCHRPEMCNNLSFELVLCR